jgi:hypothetical protein
MFIHGQPDNTNWSIGEINYRYNNKNIHIQLAKSKLNEMNLVTPDFQWSNRLKTYTIKGNDIYVLKQNDILVGIYSGTGSLSIGTIKYNTTIKIDSLLNRIGALKVIVYNSKNTRIGWRAINNIHLFCYSKDYVLYLACSGNPDKILRVDTIGLFQKDSIIDLFFYKIVTYGNHPIARFSR